MPDDRGQLPALAVDRQYLRKITQREVLPSPQLPCPPLNRKMDDFNARDLSRHVFPGKDDRDILLRPFQSKESFFNPAGKIIVMITSEEP